MSITRSPKQRLARVHDLWADGQYDQALQEVEELLKVWPGNAALHIIWAALVQLQDQPAHSLEEAKEALEVARRLDKDSPAAAIELGHFLDAVEDNPQAANKAFSEGVALARRLLVDALVGQARSLLQLNKKKEATKCLIELLYLTNFGADSRKPKSAENGPDIVLRHPRGRVSVVELKGSFSEEIESLMSDVLANKSA